MQATFQRGIALLLIAFLALELSAQDEKEQKKPEEPPPEKKFELPFWVTDRGLTIQGALHCAAGPNALGALGARMLISEYLPMTEDWRFTFDRVIPLDPRFLSMIRDGAPLPDLRYKHLQELKGSERGWYFSLTEALRRSHVATMEMFETSAAENPNVHFGQLVSNSQQYRGKVITVKGNLALIRREHPPRLIQPHVDNMKWIYTGWIRAAKRSPPYTIIFTQLPEGIDEPAENLDLPCTFHGYFLGHVRYPPDNAGFATKDVVSPYLIGKAPVVQLKKKEVAPAEEERLSFSSPLMLIAVSIVVIVIFSAAALNIWFRRGDQKVHSQLADLRDKQRPFSLEPDTAAEETPPAASEPNVENAIKPADKPNGSPPT